jgi:hypothetical protein
VMSSFPSPSPQIFHDTFEYAIESAKDLNEIEVYVDIRILFILYPFFLSFWLPYTNMRTLSLGVEGT